MPLYEYRCTSCGEHVEVLQRIGEAPLKVCPRCQGPMEKVLSAPALQFRGSGWYITDYARKGNGNGAGKQQEGTGSEKAAEGGKTAGAGDAPKAADTTTASTAVPAS